jgi:2-oxoglutarate dehydrogenase complex dehydrogenase (E1) component-like enzyme
MLTNANGCSQVISSLSDFEPGAKFQAVIDERESSAIKPPAEVQRVLICSGKVYADVC